MAQLHVGNQQFFRQFAADSELPLENRIFTTEYCTSRVQRGNDAEPADFQSPLQFDIAMQNELYFLRSCHLRLPLNAQFIDEFGNSARSPEEVGRLAVRNRPDRAFQKIEANLNGFRQTRRPNDQTWEEYLVTDDEYGLNLPNDGIGVPVSSVQVSSGGQGGTNQIANLSGPVGYTIPSEENPNFAARARTFADSWNYDKAQWQGEIQIPVQVGVHQPFSSRKSARTKFIPFIGTEQLRFDWKKYKAEFDSGEAADHMPVAKYLFEQSTRLHESARDAPVSRQIGESVSFGLWFTEDAAFMIVPHDGASAGGIERNGMRNHQDVCRRFPPGSTVEFDGAAISAGAGVANGFAANWFDKPYKVFRCQDCSLGGVGGLFGAAFGTATSGTSTTSRTSSIASAYEKFRDYNYQLNIDGGGANAVFNGTWRNATYPPSFLSARLADNDDSGLANGQPRVAATNQLGPVLCERATVVIFTKDSFSMRGKLDHNGAVMATRANVAAFMARTAAAQTFHYRDSPSVYFVCRRYKSGAAADTLKIPKEIQGQTIACELARGGHMALFGIDREDILGAGAVGGVAALAALVQGNFAQARQDASIVCLNSRFEAKEGEMPPGMTIDNDIPIYMTTGATALLHSANNDYAGRWDEYMVLRFVSAGYGAVRQPVVVADVIQLHSGMNTALTGDNVALYHTISIDEGAYNLTHDGATRAHSYPRADRSNSGRPILFEGGRYKYVVTRSRETTACPRNNLGSRTSTALQLFSDVEASNCFAYDTRVGGAGSQQYETRIPSADVPIKKVALTWRDLGPALVCEWAVLKQVNPVYQLYYPQFEKFVDDTWDYNDASTIPGVTYRYGTFPLPAPFESVKRKMNALRVNEVPSLIVISCELAETDRNRFEWLDVRAYISSMKFQLNERNDLTSNVPDIVGYRWFLENTKTLMTFEEWKANCLWVISPQQMAVDSSTFTESLARVNTISIEATIERPKAYKNASKNFRGAEFWPAYARGADGNVTQALARDYSTPRFQLTVNFMYDNHSVIMNSKREIMLRKNTIAAKGITGLTRDDRGLPRQKGLLAVGSAVSGGMSIGSRPVGPAPMQYA